MVANPECFEDKSSGVVQHLPAMLNKKAIRGGARLFLINHSGTSSQERSRPALPMLPLFTSWTALTICTSTEGKTALLTSRNRQNLKHSSFEECYKIIKKR